MPRSEGIETKMYTETDAKRDIPERMPRSEGIETRGSGCS